MWRPALATLLLGLALTASARAAEGPALSVNAASGQHAISPLIYGMNLADQDLAAETDLPVDRWGGDLFETYNFTLGAVNTAGDYFFEDIADCFYFNTGCDGGNVPFYRAFVARALARGTQPLMELPLAGYLARRAPTDHPFLCGFPEGGQQDYDMYDAGCGSGISAADGSEEAADPTNDGVAITPADQAGWVSDLKARGVNLFELGNEPALWNSTHRDIHPDPTTYDELWDKSRTLAETIKSGDPAAQVLGFSEWGWPNYFCSAKDVDHPDGYCGDGNNADRAAHGDKPLVNWLLGKFADESASVGHRLLDYVDVHYYPAGRDPSDPMDAARSLWDPTYTDPSYIDTPIMLIPRMQQWVKDDYPGTKTSLTEYDLSDPALSPQQNTVLEADALGVFGREGLDLATYFDEGYADADSQASGTRDAAPLANAFRMFRSYDGHHGEFGDTSVTASSADQSDLAVYAATRSDGTLTVMVLNKTSGALTAPLSVTGAPADARATTYQWAGGTTNSIRSLGTGPVPASAIYPADSITLYAIAEPGTTTTPSSSTGTPTPPPATSTGTTTPPPATSTGATTPPPATSTGATTPPPAPSTTGTVPALPAATATATAPVTTVASTTVPETPPLAARCRVPKTVGLTTRKASASLKRACHVRVVVKRVPAKRARRGKVLRVSVRAGTRRSPGGTVTITVGRG